MLTALPNMNWAEVAKTGSFNMLRNNLNTFMRHGVFDDKAMVQLVANKLRDPALVAKANVFPYQLFITYKTVSQTPGMPQPILLALQDAVDLATQNVVVHDGELAVFVDVSGSMTTNPVTGTRKGSTTVARSVDAAAIIASTVLRKNNHARVIPFTGKVENVALNPRDSIVTNTGILAKIGGGATNCSAPMELLNQESAKVSLILIVSDNESWINGTGGYGDRRAKATALANAWAVCKKRNPKAKLVLLDLCPGGTTQAPLNDPSILQVGSFSDQVFEVINKFVSGEKVSWVGEIEKISL